MDPKIPMYDWLKGHDVFTWLEPLWQSGKWYVTREGKLSPVRTQVGVDTPWVHHGHQVRNDCFIGQILFNHVGQKMRQFFSDGSPFVPSGCQNCYKVVVRPKTLLQLFALDDLEERMGHPSKCGIEKRDSVHGLYGGYFYNVGLEEGKACYAKVRKAIDETEYLGPEVPVILKRACTEMEHAVGPSDKWEITPEQAVIEEYIKDILVFEKDLDRQPDPVIWRTKRKWIEWAFSHGDSTYLRFTRNRPITPGYVTYQNG